jgi:hypothetical protein
VSRLRVALSAPASWSADAPCAQRAPSKLSSLTGERSSVPKRLLSTLQRSRASSGSSDSTCTTSASGSASNAQGAEAASRAACAFALRAIAPLDACANCSRDAPRAAATSSWRRLSQTCGVLGTAQRAAPARWSFCAMRLPPKTRKSKVRSCHPLARSSSPRIGRRRRAANGAGAA